jgi:hypothetical protein
VYDDSVSSYEALLRKAGKSLLYISRIKSIAIEVYNITNKLGPSMLHDMYETKDININLRDGNRVKQPNVRTTKYGIHSLRYEGAKIWNSLPASIKCAISLNNFKSLINKWNGPNCTCGFCILCS